MSATNIQDARIQPPDTPNAARAKLIFRCALDLLTLGDLTGAAALLERWHEIAPRPKISREGNQ